MGSSVVVPMANPLKLALVTRRYPPLIGGAEKVLSYLAKAFAAGGADVTVLTSKFQEPGSLITKTSPVETRAARRARIIG